jgi:signal transduction histidine kinase/ligand-binding sensor domain-containing protein
MQSGPRLIPIGAAFVLAMGPPAQEPFLRSWSAQDGLAHDRVNAIVQDGKGYLWAATWEGISRFDGRSFQSYGTADGLGGALVFALAVDPEDRLWCAPYTRGVARFVEGPRADGPRFDEFAVASDEGANNVDALLFDARGMWVGTDAGLYRAASREEPRFALAWKPPARPWRLQAFFVAEGRLWIVGAEQVLELWGEDVRVRPGPGGTWPRDNVHAMATADGRALIVTTTGLHLFDARAAVRGGTGWSAVPHELAAEEVIHSTAVDARGRFVLAGVHGLLWLDGVRPRRITTAQGLPDEWMRTLAFDRGGDLWIGSNLGGLTRLREPPLTTYRGAGRERLTMVQTMRGLDGELYATAEDRGLLRLLDEGLVSLPRSAEPSFRNLRAFHDSEGAWWLGSSEGVWCLPGPTPDLTQARLLPLEGGSSSAGELHRMADGRVLVGGLDAALYALEPGASVFQPILGREHFAGVFPRAFAEGPDGQLWIATNTGLYRFRGEGVEPVEPSGELSRGELDPRALLFDTQGVLWVGTRRHGLVWTRDPRMARPEFQRLDTRSGLPSDHVTSLAEDGRGCIWLGTGRGLVRLDRAAGSLRRFTVADGLAGEMVNDIFLDHDGTLWVAAAGGLSHLDPALEPAPSPEPPVFVRRFVAGGRVIPLPDSGARALTDLNLAPSEHTLGIAFSAIDLARGEHLRFQHQLEGLEDDWSSPSSETSVTYGSLAPGPYRFRVRALTYDGVASAVPAEVTFELAAPFWRRAWFACLVVAGAGALALGVLHLRKRRRRVLERIRNQIATDLHDEVGASLAEIAVLSEVARRERGPEAADRLGQVAALARTTRASMADLVWAVDPTRDTLAELLRRLRAVTSNLFAAEGVELVLKLPEEAALAGLALAPDRRRHLLFAAKEALHNVERHACARRVELELVREARQLRLVVRDDGRGFDPTAVSAGHGLASLQRRARELGGELRIETRLGGGTRVELVVPL